MKTITIERGSTSFCDGHGTRFWAITFNNVKRKIYHEIITYDNDLTYNKTYHCYIMYPGCIPAMSFNTDNFKDAYNWMKAKLKINTSAIDCKKLISADRLDINKP